MNWQEQGEELKRNILIKLLLPAFCISNHNLLKN